VERKLPLYSRHAREWAKAPCRSRGEVIRACRKLFLSERRVVQISVKPSLVEFISGLDARRKKESTVSPHRGAQGVKAHDTVGLALLDGENSYRRKRKSLWGMLAYYRGAGVSRREAGSNGAEKTGVKTKHPLSKNYREERKTGMKRERRPIEEP